MITIHLDFPAGRYHATPWGHHVNEGLVEWPPSPWRLLRALLAVGFAKQGWTGPEALPSEAVGLIYALAETLPSYRLPVGGVAHTRHYLPFTEGKAQKTTKVLDAFLRFRKNSDGLYLTWPLTLPADQRQLLAHLLAGLPYLGRAEAWVEATLLETDPPDDQWTVPTAEGEPVDPGWEQVTVLAPVSAEIYAAWRHTRVPPVSVDGKKGKPAKVKKSSVDDLYPGDLVSCLCADTATLQKQGWSQPPGSRRVLYRRPTGSLEPGIIAPHRIPARREPVEFALLALSADTQGGTLLPLMNRCLRQAEFLHASWVKQLGEDVLHPIVSGRAAEGAPLTGHRHAHLLPLDLDANGRMDHVLVWAKGLMDQTAQQALLRLSRTWGKDLPSIVVTCAGMGSRDDLVRQLRDRTDQLPPLLGLAPTGTARTWTSSTPFIAPRFRKPNGGNSLIGQVLAECRSRDLPEPIQVKDLGRDEMVRRGFLDFLRNRANGHSQPPSTMPWCLELTFAEPIAGPICLGYGSHFGLGLFEAVSPEPHHA